ncbi:MAG: M23 family metallopeptidase [Flavobacteriales bacterium]|nr:M23 family metallopeptidase [Flavobacteriales bacterium]
MKRNWLISFFFPALVCCWWGVAVAQTDSVVWQAPLDIPLFLAGNFGELRSNHFHSGLDIKTQGREGLTVRAAEEGYVSRIKISPYGYGLAVYVTHPNGYTTVYAHLQRYSAEIEAFAKEAQYDLQQFEVDLFPTPGQLPVAQGQMIGLSGNSGSSGGPHLHFEIRETESEFPVNPLLFNLEIQDDVAPEIREVMIIPLNDRSWADGQRDAVRLGCSKNANGAYKTDQSRVYCQGKIGLAIDVIDKLNGFPNKCGVYEIRMYANDELTYEQVLDKLCFDTKRYVNSHQVYGVNRSERKYFQRSYLLPANGLDIYGVIRNGGSIEVSPGEVVQVRYEITDVAGNRSTVEFKLEGSEPPATLSAATAPTGELMRYDTVNAFRSDECTVYLPEGRLYDDLHFEYTQSKGPSGALSDLHAIGSTHVPVHNDFTLKIKCDSLQPADWPFALVARYNPRSKGYVACGGKYRHGWVETRVNQFGSYCVLLDSVPPVIRNVDLADNMKGRTQFNVRITDDLSGIESWNAFVNGHWILGSYDPKRNTVVYELDASRIPKADRYELLIEVKDERGNTATMQRTISF